MYAIVVNNAQREAIRLNFFNLVFHFDFVFPACSFVKAPENAGRTHFAGFAPTCQLYLVWRMEIYHQELA